MRVLLVLLTATSTGRAGEAPFVSGRPPLLDAAFQAFLHGQQRWAYTETHTSFGPDGQAQHVSAICVDPSLPYAGPFLPLKLNGRAPTEKEIKAWAQRGEDLARRRQAAADKLAALPNVPDFRIQLLNQEVTPVLDRASVVAENELSVTYLIPLRQPGGPDALPFETFQLTARVGKSTRQFEHATFRQRTPIRIAAGKHFDGLIEVEFGAPDPQFPAVPVKITRRSTNKPLFGGPFVSHNETQRTGLRRVTPYDERFQVKLAPLRLIEF